MQELSTHVLETPLAPTPPLMPTHRAAQFIAITPARVQRQRWSNWAWSRLAHLPPPESHSPEAIVTVECPVDVEIQTEVLVETAANEPEEVVSYDEPEEVVSGK